MTATAYIAAVELDPLLAEAVSPQLKQDRDIAIHDLVTANNFQPTKLEAAAYGLSLSYMNARLTFELSDPAGEQCIIALSLTPFRRLFRDYFDMYDSYQAAILKGGAAHVEAIDMARRGIHNDLADVLIERLDGKANLDHETSRRLISVIASLFYKKGLI